MTVDLKIEVQNGAVTITVGGKSPKKSASPVSTLVPKDDAPPVAEPGAAADHSTTDPGGGPGASGVMVIGPIIISGMTDAGSAGSSQAGAAADHSTTDPGGGPGALGGSGVTVLGPILIAGGGGGGTDVKPGTPSSVAPPPPPPLPPPPPARA